MAYNPVTGHILLVSRETNTVIRSIAILDPATGAELGSLKTTGIAGGTFLLSRIAVAEDGAIYASNFGSTSGTTETSFLRVYRWANETAEPTVAYAGNPTNAQYGKNLAIRGSGVDTQILLETRGTFVVMLVTSDGVNFTPVVVQTNGRSDDFSVGTGFGEGNTIWGKNTFEPLQQFELDITNKIATLVKAYPDFPGDLFSNFSFSEDGRFLAGLVVTPTGPDVVEIYDISDLDRGPVLLDTAAFTADNLNGVFGGNVVFAGNKLIALSSNNGIIAFDLPAAGNAPELSIAKSGNNVVITWPTSATGFVLESSPVVPSTNWTPVTSETVGNTQRATFEAIGEARFFRLRKIAQ